MEQIVRTFKLIAGCLLVLLPTFGWAVDIPTFRVAAFNYYPAIFLDSDNQARGFYVDMLNELAAREKIRFDYVFGSWNDGLERLRTGEVDLVTSAAYTEERAGYMAFGRQPLLTVWGELYLHRDVPAVSIRELQNMEIAVMRGDHNARSFMEHLDKFGISCRFVEFADFDQVFQAVREGQVTGGIVNSVFGDAAAKSYDMHASGIAFNPFDIYFATAKGQHAELLALLDQALAEWRNDSASVYYQARLKWGSVLDSEAAVPDWMMKAAGLAALLLLVGLIFILLLRCRINTATRQLQDSNAMIRLLLDSTAEAIYGLNRQGICTFCNAACARILGYEDASRLIGRNMHDLIHHTHADGTPMPAGDCNLLKGLDQQIHSDTEVLWRADGSSFPAEYWSYPIRQEGKNIGMVVSFVDISERKRIESDLIEQKNAYQNILSASLDGFISADTTGKILDVNPAYLAFSGYSRDELLKLHLSDLEAHESPEELARHAAKVVEKGGDVFESRHRCKDGSIWSVEINATYSPFNDGRFYTFLRDITARKQAERILQEKNQEIEQLVYTVSHDLKSPLITVKTFTELLRQDLPDSDPQQIELDLNYIDKAADKMHQLLEALLRYSRVGRKDAPQETIPATQPLTECLTALAGIIQQEQVRIRVGDLPYQLHGDPLHFGQIWQNLIENAVKYRGDQSHLQLDIGAIRQAQDIAFYVRDNGMGIEPEHGERIFHLFTKLNPASEGSGLGLALVKKIVSVYQGRLWVESEGINKGSCFWFTLPGALK